MSIGTKSLLSVADLSREGIERLLERASRMKHGQPSQPLQGRTLALLFKKPSLRTRVSFETAMIQLGGHAIYLSPAEVGLGKREPVADVARVLSRYTDAVAARTFDHATLHLLALNAGIPVINALSDIEHPCQALSDLFTIWEKKGRLPGLTLAFVGDSNNVANSLLLASVLTGMNFRIASPHGYAITESVLDQGRGLADSSGSQLTLTSDPCQAVEGADVVYTDVWTSMGQEAEADRRRVAFRGYQVDEGLLRLANEEALFMHPLPAHHGEEISAGLLDHPQSVVFDQAENRLHLQKALLASILAPTPAQVPIQ